MTQTVTEGECLEKTEAEIWVMCSQTSKYQSLLTKYRSQDRGLETLFLCYQKESTLPSLGSRTSVFQKGEMMSFSC